MQSTIPLLSLSLLLALSALPLSVHALDCNGTYCHDECELCSTDPTTDEQCVLMPNKCLIRGFCYDQGHIFTQKNGLSFCQICNVSRSTDDWTRPGQSVPCNDGIYCNGHDWCTNPDGGDNFYACSGHSGDPCSDSANACNNTCSESEHTCNLPDGTLCGGTDADACHPMACNAGSCDAVTNPDPPISCVDCGCQSGTCDELTGACVSATPGEEEDSDGGINCSWTCTIVAGIIGGVVVLAVLLLVLMILRAYKIRAQTSLVQTVYYKANDTETETLYINKDS